MADMDKIMDELLKTTAEEDELSNEDADIYNGSSHDDISGYDFGNPDEEEEEEEDEWEYQTEYDEWENEMESLDYDYVRKIDNIGGSLEDIRDFINDDDHRYWPDERSRIEGMIDAISSAVDDLYHRAEDYRNNPEDW